LAEKSSKQREKSRRLRERIALSLPARVLCRESADNDWTEMSRLVDVTPFGARLRLKRPIEIGRLLLVTMAMPRQLRCFDHVEDQYRVWSLVRNLKLLNPASEKGALVEIGVAFVGKRPPRSFESDPTSRYTIAQSAAEAGGLWAVKEEPREIPDEEPPDQRKETRHIIPIEVLIELIGDDGNIVQSESTVTENINQQGAAVFTTLEAARGRFVRISSTQGTQLLAVVRRRSIGTDGIARLHLEFVGSEWPL
jgi:hypothetical protein